MSASATRHSLRGLLADAAGRLAAAGVATPAVDAELLLAAAVGVPRSRLLGAQNVPAEAASTFAGYVARRAAREPLQHITGTAPFRRVEVAVGPGVFVPRPETELLVDAVLPHLLALPVPSVVDLCAGSGALALALADEAPNARVVAVERDRAALEWLRRNADGTRVEVVAGDVTDPSLSRQLAAPVDAVVSNPPYVPDAVVVEPEVHADPPSAVFAGPEGLAVIPSVVARAAELLAPGGWLALEHDETHGAAVLALLEADDRFADVADNNDLTGRSRFATARRCSPPR